MVSKRHAEALAQVLALLESFPRSIRLWLVHQIGSFNSSSPGSLSVHQEVHREVRRPVHSSVHSQVQQPVHSPEVPPKNPPGCVVLFEQFWAAFPRRVGKQDCLRIYRKLQPNQELQDRILRAVREQSTSDQWTKDNGQFIPLPKTWLNRGSWDDSLTVHSPVHRKVTARNLWDEAQREKGGSS